MAIPGRVKRGENMESKKTNENVEQLNEYVGMVQGVLMSFPGLYMTIYRK